MRICFRDKEQLDDIIDIPFFTILFNILDISLINNSFNLSIMVIRCLSNSLYQDTLATNHFLSSDLDSIQHLITNLSTTLKYISTDLSVGDVVAIRLIFFMIRLLYMLISERYVGTAHISPTIICMYNRIYTHIGFTYTSYSNCLYH